jgi:hypothetical protein
MWSCGCFGWGDEGESYPHTKLNVPHPYLHLPRCVCSVEESVMRKLKGCSNFLEFLCPHLPLAYFKHKRFTFDMVVEDWGTHQSPSKLKHSCYLGVHNHVARYPSSCQTFERSRYCSLTSTLLPVVQIHRPVSIERLSRSH